MIVSRNKKEKKLEVQRLGAKFSPEMLGDSDIKRKHHLSNKSYDKRMDLLSRIHLMSPPLPLAMVHEWECRKMAYCKRCPQRWGRSTGSKFQQATNLLVCELGVHYGGYDRVQAALTDQDKAFLKKYMTKPKDNKEAFIEFVQGLSEWMPQSMTAAYN